MIGAASPRQWARLAGFVGARLGLHFPPARWPDLQRGLTRALPAYGFADAGACIDWLTGAPADDTRLQLLAAELTVGETYFFREPATLDAFSQTILPALIRERQGGNQRLSLWSAGCCTGEEAYTLAILLHRLLPDRADWQVSIIASDINVRFLEKAAEATYGEWSFRTVPAGLQASYFTPARPGRYTVIPEIRRMVSFRRINLAEDDGDGPQAIDVLFCRNVLMYFGAAQRKKVVGRLGAALAPGGWLAVSPSEATQTGFPGLHSHSFPGASVFRKPGASAGDARALPARPLGPAPAALRPAPEPADAMRIEAPHQVPAGRPALQPADAASLAQRARALADEGRLDEALACCDRWLEADRVDPQAHYLRAIVLLERGPGDADAARQALQRALFLQPDFPLAQLAQRGLAQRGLAQRGLAERRRRHDAPGAQSAAPRSRPERP